MKETRLCSATLGLLVFTAVAQGTISIEFVTVDNAGNTGEWCGGSYGGEGPDRICGAVDYIFNMGKYEITAGQYCEFLNAVAKTDTYGVYSTSMLPGSWGCNIQRIGSPGGYTYVVPDDPNVPGREWDNRPVNFVTWGDAARFCNWLTNGQPTGAQDLSTTEDGSYYLNGAMLEDNLLPVTRKTPDQGGRYFIPTEDEWHKAAYHKNDGTTGNYYDYPTTSDLYPSNQLIHPDPGNTATIYSGGYTIGVPYMHTEIGDHESSESPYGTFDQCGNVREWTETVSGVGRIVRGGDFTDYGIYLHSGYRLTRGHTFEGYSQGFRVAEVPEPVSIALLALGALGFLRRRGVYMEPPGGDADESDPQGPHNAVAPSVRVHRGNRPLIGFC